MSDTDPPDFDVAIIGAGSGGMAAARRARELGLSVVQFEAREVGGTCVNRGCVPKKLLVTASRQGDAIGDAEPFGWSVGDRARFDWPTVRDAVARKVRSLSEHQGESLEGDGVTLVRRRVRLAGGGWIVTADDDEHGGEAGRWRARDIVLATGSRPLVPDLPGAELALVSDDLFGLESLPERLALVGGGYIAVEFANMMQRFGVEVTVFQSGDQLLKGFDEEVVSCLEGAMRDDGIEIVCGTRAKAIERNGEGLFLRLDGGEDRGGFDAVALVIGRAPNVEGLGLETAGVELDDDGLVRVDGYGRTTAERVHAVGDIVETLQLTPVAIEGGRAAIDAIAGRTFERTQPEHVPTAAYSTPECGSVGVSEADAVRLGIAHEVRRAHFRPLDDTLSGRPRHVLIKLVVERVTGRLLGFHSFGHHAAETTQMAALPIRARLTEHDLHRTMSLHPTHAEEIVSLGRPDRPTHRRADGD